MESYQRDLLKHLKGHRMEKDHNHYNHAIPQNQRTSILDRTKHKDPCWSYRTPLSQMAPGNDPVDAQN
jgi:hypothetical protein